MKKRYVVKAHLNKSDSDTIISSFESRYDGIIALNQFMDERRKSESGKPYDSFILYDTIAGKQLAHTDHREHAIIFDSKPEPEE